MAVKKSKDAPALTVPQDDPAADAVLKFYGDTFNALARLKIDMDEELAAVKARYEVRAAPLQAELKSAFAGLEAFAAAHRKRLLGASGGKTVKMKAGELGWRNRPASVKFSKGLKIEDIVANIKAAGLRKFLRLSAEPNKEAMLADPKNAAKVEGVRIGSEGETFFVIPFGAELAEPKS